MGFPTFGLFGGNSSTPFYTRLPVAMMTGDGLILTSHEKVRSYIIASNGSEGLSNDVLEYEFKKISEFLKNMTAQNSFVQFSYILNADMSGLMDAHLKLCNKDPVLEAIAKENIQAFTKGGPLQSVDTTLLCTITVPLNVRASVDGKKKMALDEIDFANRDREMNEAEMLLFNTLVPLGYDIQRLSGNQLLGAMAQIINPESPPVDMDFALSKLQPLRKRLFHSDFNVEEFYLTNGTYYFASLVMDTIPSYIPNDCGMKLFQELDFPLVYNATFFNEDQGRLMKDLETQRLLATIFSGKKAAASVENKEKVIAIEDMLADRAREGWKIGKCFFSFLVWDRDKGVLQEKLQRIRVAAAKAMEGAGIFTEWWRKESAFVASLPSCAVRSFDMQFIYAHEAMKLIPFRGMYRGDREEPSILFKNRFSGITSINPFSPKQNKWAGIVVGPSGSGKSFFVNSLIAGAMIHDPVVFIVDMAEASSYEPVVRAFGGSFIPVGMKDTYRVNLFDLRLGFTQPTGSKQMSLDAMLTRMLVEEGEDSLPKETQGVLQRAVKRVYERLFREEPRKVRNLKLSLEMQEALLAGAPKFETFMEYRDYYIQKFTESSEWRYYNKAEMAQSMATPILTDFVQVLSSDGALNTSERDREINNILRRTLTLYTSGPQSVLFNGVTNLIVDKDVYCFHLGAMRGRKEVLAMLLLLYRDYAYRKSVYNINEMPPFAKDSEWILKVQKRPKLFIYDEFHNLRGDRVILNQLDKDSRQQRTLGIGTYLVTQEIMDIASSNKQDSMGVSFLGSSPNKYFTRQITPESPAMEPIDNIVSVLGLGPDEKELLKSLRFFPGKFAEILAMNEEIGRGVIINYPTSLSRWMYTTHRDERAARDALAVSLVNEKGCSERKALSVALQVLADQYPDGGIGKNIEIFPLLKKIDSDGYFN